MVVFKRKGQRENVSKCRTVMDECDGWMCVWMWQILEKDMPCELPAYRVPVNGLNVNLYSLI